MEQGMQNKKPNSSNWKDKLEDDTAFAAGELPETNAAWDKLYNRMHQPRRNKAIWYWMAAASLVIGIFFTVIISQQNTPISNAVVKTTTEKQIDKSASDKKENEKPIAVVIENKKEDVKKNHKTTMRNTALIPEQKEQQLTVNNDNKITEAPSTSLTVEVNQLNDTAPSTQIVFIQPKPKLKVVHINELGNANHHNNNNQAGDYGVLQFGVNNQRIYNTAPLPSGKIGLNISTSKTSPSN
jgi:hypothetical protein